MEINKNSQLWEFVERYHDPLFSKPNNLCKLAWFVLFRVIFMIAIGVGIALGVLTFPYGLLLVWLVEPHSWAGLGPGFYCSGIIWLIGIIGTLCYHIYDRINFKDPPEIVTEAIWGIKNKVCPIIKWEE